MALKKMNVFLQDIKGFLKVGFELEAEGTSANSFKNQDDQVLLLAYFPGETAKIRIFTTSVRRSAGTYKFNLNRSARMRNAHLYLSFVSDDYKSISDSVYLGEVSWDKVAK